MKAIKQLILSLFIIVLSMLSVKADDVCYDPVTTQGFNMFGFEMFYGVTTPIRNISGQNLSDVTIIKSFDGINMSMMSNIKLDDVVKTTTLDTDEAEINQALSTTFGSFNLGGMFDKGVVYHLNGANSFLSNATHTIYDYSMFSFSWANVSINAIYTKDGIQYSTKINACPTATVGGVVKNFRPFTLRNTNGSSGDNIYGDFNVTGAPIMCAKNSNNNNCNWSYNGYLADAYGKFLTDKPTSQIPLNSSSADLTIPTDATVTKAYLYWNGHIHGTSYTQAAFDTAVDGYNSVIFRTPDGADHTVTANTSDNSKVNYYSYINSTTNTKGFRHFYQATVDVTDIVKNGGYNGTNKKTFTVGNLKATSGNDDNMYEPELAGNVKWGPMGGWSLIVEYERPKASGQKYKNVSIYDGFQFLLPPTNQDEQIDISISGFLTPLSQTPTGSMAFYAMGAEKILTGEKVQIANKAGTMNNLYNSTNAVDSQLNDSITINGSQVTSGRVFNPGIDLDVFSIQNSCKTSGGATVACIDSNQTSTTIRLGVHNTNNTSDQSFPGMIAFSVDIYQPDISAFSKISDTSSTQKLNPGDSVEYALDFNNSGTEAAENITIYDTFSSTVGGDMLLDVIDRNSTAIKNSIRLKDYSEGTFHCAIGSTDSECASLAKDANCSVDYADANISKATKVWCFIPYMDINDRYIMKFDVKVRDDYNNTNEQNVTNVAYSHYYNAATHEEITVPGQSNINTAGYIGGVAYGGAIDIVDNFNIDTYNYYINPPNGLETKVSNKDGITLQAVYLGLDSTNYQPTIYSGNNYDMRVLYRLSNDSCTQDEDIGVDPYIEATFVKDANQYTAVSQSFRITNKAQKVARIKVHFIDWNKISFASFNGNNCVSQSSIDGNLKGVPACLNGNSDKIDDLFTYDVSICSTAQTGKDAPCDSNAYNASGSKGNIAPEKYNNTYGCLMCLSDAVNGSSNCSKDTFALRPDRFDLSSTNTHMPDLLRAGSDYNTTLNAYDFGVTVNTLDYNQTKNQLDLNNSVVLAKDGSATLLDGNVTFESLNFSIENGQSLYNGASEVVGINFDNVGKVKVVMQDRNWAATDNDDTPQDCNGTWVCGEKELTFIPHHFGIANVSLGNTGNSFTYLANLVDGNQSTYAMAGRVQSTIIAQSEINATATNFRSGVAYYENPISIDLNASHILHGDANATTISTALLGFGTGTDTNGTKNIIFNDTNLSKVLRFNFLRQANVAVNPFDANASDINISCLSSYTGVAGNANISGFESGLGDGNTTFVYGRTNASKQRYQGNAGNANIYFESFCFGATCNTALLPNGATSRKINDARWYINDNHISTTDGNVTIVVQKGGTNVGGDTVTATDNPAGNPSQTALNYNGTQGYPYKTTIENGASPWLIYNESDPTATRNEFQVEFDSVSGWSGEHETNTTTKNRSGTNTNRRVIW